MLNQSLQYYDAPSSVLTEALRHREQGGHARTHTHTHSPGSAAHMHTHSIGGDVTSSTVDRYHLLLDIIVPFVFCTDMFKVRLFVTTRMLDNLRTHDFVQ